MTLLSVLGSNAIAVPLSPSFPSGELKYILEQSGALMLLSSSRFETKAQEVMKEEMESRPTAATVKKITESRISDEKVTLESVGQDADKGGMMLYTSGTTNRPVRDTNLVPGWPKLTQSCRKVYSSLNRY